MKYSQIQIKNIILEVERLFPVSQWSVNGIHIWPNIRFQLYFDLLNASDHSLNSTTNKVQGSSRLKHLYGKISAIFSYFLFCLKHLKIDILFMGLKMHRVKYKKSDYQRFFDPIVEAYPGIQPLHFELDHIEQPFFTNQTTSLIPILEGFKTWRKLSRSFLKPEISINQIDLPEFARFENYVKKQQWGIFVSSTSEDMWLNWARRVSEKAVFFDFVFKRCKPRLLIMASYYGFENTAAAIVAARKLNILSIDFQHGPQSSTHMAYAKWKNLPKNGFNTMPDYYWCWDGISAAGINKWNLTQAAFVGGNTWLQETVANKTYTPQTVLYSLQVLNKSNVDYFFNENILSAIKQSQDIWILRLHPRSEWVTRDLRQYIQSCGVPENNYIIETASDAALVDSLLNAKVHLTNYSGVFLEARLLGVPNIVIDDSGKAMFESYLDSQDNLFLHKDDQEFVAKFNNYSTSFAINEKSFDNRIINPLELFAIQ